ncbi:hypothetical protein Q1695_015148 [Nippostrongylus brasiliensis]|nr:hypothetical protein Q1695_015148 [Nippostrongylus brasiliensis]
MSIQQGCLMFGDRIVIPTTLQAAVLRDLHNGHPGISRMKMLARDYCYWPNVDKHMEDMVNSCRKCQESAKNPVKTTLSSWPTETVPWSRIHADYAGPINGKMFLVVVDACSKWPEIVEMSSSTSSATLKELRRMFTQYGYPETLVTDNGTQFTSKDFSEFCSRNGIKHVRTPPFHPQSNGQVERFVDTFKRALQKLRGEGTIQESIQTFLFNYRRTPCPSVPGGRSPAEVFLGRRLRSTLTMLKPNKTEVRRHDEKMEEQFNLHHGARERTFEPGDPVWVRDYRDGHPKWTPGQILNKHGRCVYDITVQNQIWRRQANQLRKRKNRRDVPMVLDDIPLLPCQQERRPTQTNGSNQLDNLPSDSQVPTIPTSSDLVSRPIRNRRPPSRLNVDPKKKTYAAVVRLRREVLE